jgi:hypothetical protein
MQQFIAQQPGGILAILTILLVLIFLSAWKAPRWVRPIGSIAFGFCILFLLYTSMEVLTDIWKAGDISITVLGGGLKLMFFTLIYGFVIYLISHVISFIQKPGH